MIEFAGNMNCQRMLHSTDGYHYYCNKPAQLCLLLKRSYKRNGNFDVYHTPTFRCEKHLKEEKVVQDESTTVIYCCKYLVMKAAKEIIQENNLSPCTVCDPPTKYHLDGSEELWEKVYGKAKIIQPHS